MLSEKQKQQIITSYQNGKKIKEISIEFLHAPKTISKILKSNKIPIRQKGPLRKYNFNNEAFENITTEEQSYWLGFILADGGIYKNHLTIELSEIDFLHLEKFKKFMQSNCKITFNRNCCRIVFNSKKLIQSLEKYGIVKNKTYSYITTPKIPYELLNHFYRGFFDGDGWTSQRYRHNKKPPKEIKKIYEFGFSSYYSDFLQEIKNWININIQRTVGYIILRQRPNQKCHELHFGGNIVFQQVYHLLYNNSNIYLQRKYEKVMNAIKYIEITNP